MFHSRLKLPADHPDQGWFNSVPFYVVFSLIIAIYALSGVYFRPLHVMLESVVNPVVAGFAVVHLKILPVTRGPLDASLYRNLSGLSVIGGLLHNLVLLAWMIKNKRTAALDCITAHENLMARKQWGSTRAWIMLHGYVYAGMGIFVAFGTWGLLNGLYQWVGFTVEGDDAISLTMIPLFFFVVGSSPLYFCSIYAKYFIFDGKYLIKRYRGKVNK